MEIRSDKGLDSFFSDDSIACVYDEKWNLLGGARIELEIPKEGGIGTGKFYFVAKNPVTLNKIFGMADDIAIKYEGVDCMTIGEYREMLDENCARIFSSPMEYCIDSA